MKINLICIAAVACSNSTTTTNDSKQSPQSVPDTIINNLTFDMVKTGWADWCNHLDSCAQIFIADVPPGSSAQRSLLLWPIWTPNTTWIHTDLVGRSSGVYKLTVWAKADSVWGFKIKPNAFGTFGIRVGSATTLGYQDFGTEGTRVTGSAWRQYTLLDTVTMLPTDTLRVFLTGGCSDTANSWSILFNNVSLIRLK